MRRLLGALLLVAALPVSTAESTGTRVDLNAQPLLPPTQVSAESLYATSAQASWTPPADLGPNEYVQYRIWLSADGGRTWNSVGDTEDTRTVLHHLLPDTNYLIRVSAKSARGVTALSGGWPTQIVDTGWSQCGVFNDGSVRCWGERNKSMSLNEYPYSDAAIPVVVRGVVGTKRLIATSQGFCALTSGSEIYCWGSGHPYWSQLITERDAVQTLYAVRPGAYLMAEAPNALCVVDDRGLQCGNGSQSDISAAGFPSAAEGAGALDLDGNRQGACLVRADGTVLCWGNTYGGRLGTPDTEYLTNPKHSPTLRAQTVPGLSNILSVAVGPANACAIDAKGAVYCWGRGQYGQTVPGVIDAQPNVGLPVTRISLPEAINSMDLGESSTCAQGISGRLYCWGFGVRGWGRTAADFALTEMPTLADAHGFAVADAHMCALIRDATWADSEVNSIRCAGLIYVNENSPAIPAKTQVSFTTEPATVPYASLVTVSRVSTGSNVRITVRWRTDDDGGAPVLRYRIQVRAGQRVLASRLVSGSSTSTSVVLPRGATGTVSVIAYNRYGASTPSAAKL